MTRTRAQALIAEAVAAVIEEYPDAPADAQARHAVRALQQDGWYVGPIPPTIRLAKEHQGAPRP